MEQSKLFGIIDNIVEKIQIDNRIDDALREQFNLDWKSNEKKFSCLFALYLRENKELMDDKLIQNVMALRKFSIKTLGELAVFAQKAIDKKVGEFTLKTGGVTLRFLSGPPLVIMIHRNEDFYPLFKCTFEEDRCHISHTDVHKDLIFDLKTSLCKVAEELYFYNISWEDIDLN